MAAKKDSGNGNDFHDRGDDVRDGDDNESLLEHGDGIPDDEIEISLDEESTELTEIASTESQRQILSLVERKTATEDAAEQARQNEPNLVKRAKILNSLQVINFEEVKWVKEGGMPVPQPVSCDMNRIAVFKALFGEDKQRPHFDEFVGRVVDHRGVVIDDHYPAVDLLAAVSAAGMKRQSAKMVRETLREYALTCKRNDMIESFTERLPKWDRKSRLDTLLLDLFQPFDTELNHKVGRYFFLSLYARIMHPGSMAPLVVFLVGGQNAGKSHFGRLICRFIMGNKDADSVPLDLSGNKNDFLREITGTSVIAQIGEMTGFTKGDLNKIKDFVTRTSDNLNYKFEGNILQPRQWVMVMDGNTYEGVNRDETGNRRFYPFFAKQLPDDAGKPQWDNDFKVDFSNFEEDFWQVMAEAHEEYERIGDHGYVAFVNEVVREVKTFNFHEMKNDRGTIRDDKLDIHLLPALKGTNMKTYSGRKDNPNTGMIVDPSSLMKRLSDVFRLDVNFKHLETKMSALGFEKITGAGNRKFFLFRNCFSEEAVHRELGLIEPDEEFEESKGMASGEHEGF